MAHGPTLIASVSRALHLLDEVGAADGPISAKVLAHRTGLALPTVYHLLRTLVHEGYLERLDGMGYVLGTRVSALADVPSRSAARSRRQHEVLHGLHVETAAAAYLSVLADGEVHLLEVVDSSAAPRVPLWADLEAAAHATALGKALLGALPEPGRREYLATHALADLTPRTLTDPRVLLHQLATSAELAVDREEYILRSSCVAVAVQLPTGPVAVAVSVPSQRLDRVADGAAVRRAARRLALDVAV